jgi:hypothetical protein
VPEPNINNVRNAMILWRETYLDTASAYRIDSYLLTGMGAVDLILLTILVPLGVSDDRLFWAFIALIVSLVLAGAALFINFVKRDLGITAYGKIHGAGNGRDAMVHRYSNCRTVSEFGIDCLDRLHRILRHDAATPGHDRHS